MRRVNYQSRERVIEYKPATTLHHNTHTHTPIHTHLWQLVTSVYPYTSCEDPPFC